MKTQVSINIPIWMILGIGVFVFIIMLLRNYNKDKEIFKKIQKTCDEENLDNEESSLNWIEKKDLLYWLIIICLGTISIFTFQYREASEVIDHWGFAGTIISIILAVLAIIYTYYQSATTVDSTKRLERSAKKVAKATTRVEKATKELEDNKISTVITELEERLYSILQDMEKGLHENISTNFEPIKSFMNLQKESTNQDKTIQILTDEEWQRYIHNAVVKDLLTEGMTLVYACFLYENDLEFSPNGTRKWLKSVVVEKDTEVEVFVNIIHAQLKLFASLNVLTFEYNVGENNGAKFTYINQTVFNEIKKILEEPSGDVKNMLSSLKGSFKVE